MNLGSWFFFLVLRYIKLGNYIPPNESNLHKKNHLWKKSPFCHKTTNKFGGKKNKHCLDSIFVALFWLSIVVLKLYFLDAYCFGSVYTWEPKYTYSTSHVCSLMVKIIKQIQLWSLGVYMCMWKEREIERIKIIKCVIYYFILLHSIISNMDAKCTWF